MINVPWDGEKGKKITPASITSIHGNIVALTASAFLPHVQLLVRDEKGQTKSLVDSLNLLKDIKS